MSSDTYPAREPFFASKFTRLLTKTAAAQVIGADGCWMLSVIAHQEDSARYRPVTFWNGQLQPLCGFGNEKKLVRVRKRAVENGWLHYEPGGKSRAGLYWVTVPEQHANLGDGPIDEGLPPVLTVDFDGTSGGQSTLTVDSDGQSAGQRAIKVQDKGVTSLPIPIPKESAPSKTTRFVKPTLKEVAAYCRERNNGIDPEQFFNFYEASGWIRGKNTPMKNWKAQVLTWEKRDGNKAKSQSTGPKMLTEAELKNWNSK